MGMDIHVRVHDAGHIRQADRLGSFLSPASGPVVDIQRIGHGPPIRFPAAAPSKANKQQRRARGKPVIQTHLPGKHLHEVNALFVVGPPLVISSGDGQYLILDWLEQLHRPLDLLHRGQYLAVAVRHAGLGSVVEDISVEDEGCVRFFLHGFQPFADEREVTMRIPDMQVGHHLNFQCADRIWKPCSYGCHPPTSLFVFPPTHPPAIMSGTTTIHIWI